MPIMLMGGLGMVGIAIFARQIGLDHDASWGIRRAGLMILGTLLLLASQTFSPWCEKILPNSHPILLTLRRNDTYIWTGFSGLVVITAYVWFVSAGLWTTWPKTTYTYDLLASAFQHQQLALEDQPDLALLALPNPYDSEARANVKFLWDASLYKGKYYLYFGPAPALLLAGVKALIPGQIADQYLVFAFVCGLFLFSSLLIISFRHRFFQDTPKWTLPLNVVLVGLVCPHTWLLSRPAGYEVAIASSQFFFIGGLYFAYTALERQLHSNWRSLLAGTLWIGAIGSRTTTAIPVIFTMLMLSWWVLKSGVTAQNSWQSFSKLAAFLLPLIVGTAALGWYNLARFDSVFELGLRYQLTWIDLNRFQNQIFSARYVLPNLYAYLLTPFELIRPFPFMKPQIAQTAALIRLLQPSIYRPEQVTGLLLSSPALLLAMVPCATVLSKESRQLLREEITETNRKRWLLIWISITLIGSALLSFMVLLFFFYATMRYLEDVIPALVLLSVLGLWQGLQRLNQRPRIRIIYSLASIFLVSFSMISGILLAVTGYEERFRHLNRPLLQELIRFFGH